MATITAHQPAPGIIRLRDGRHTVGELTTDQARQLRDQLDQLLSQHREQPGPRLRLLGPVEVTNAHGRPPQAPARALELVTFLALHPWRTSEPLDAALWPNTRVTANKRNGPVNQARQWLGTAPDGHPYLCHVDQGGYALAPEMRTDWTAFREATAQPTSDNLIRALQLVAGPPLSGVNPARYAWADPDRQDMITAITTVAHTLVLQSITDHDLQTAAWAAARGVMVDPSNEQLWIDALDTARRNGDPTRLEAISAQRHAALAPLS